MLVAVVIAVSPLPLGSSRGPSLGQRVRQTTRLPANGGALGTRVRAATEHPIGVVEGDALGMAHHRIVGFDELHMMALRPQLRDGLRWEVPLQPQRLPPARRLDAVNPARLLDGRL